MGGWSRRDALLGLLAGGGHGLLAAAGRKPADTAPVRMAFIDPLSGPSADIGRNSLRSWQFMARHLPARTAARVRFLVAGFDNKGSPQESINALKAAIDQGFRYIIQGNGSGVATALSAAIGRHNARFPDRAVLLINYAAMDPALTAERCSYWHFRIDADTAMKMRALTRFMAAQPGLERVYLINQNYAHGQQFARYFLQESKALPRAPQVVGDELHVPFAIEDFSEHVRRIRASGAQAVVTGNWGGDLRHLLKAMQAEALWLPVFAYYPALVGTPTVLAASGERLPVYQVAANHGEPSGEVDALARGFRQAYGEDLVVMAAYDGVRMLLHAMGQVGSGDPAAVAGRLEGMIFPGFDGPVSMRAADHQLQKGIYISRWRKVAGDGAEGTGYAFVPVQHLPAASVAPEPRCQMDRP